MTGYPVPLDSRTTQKKSSWNIIKDRYGKPVLTPIWGADVTESRCIEVVQPSMMTAAEGQTPRKETILKTSWPKIMDNNRFEQPLQPPVRGANMTIPDHVTMKQKSGMTAPECQIPPNGVTIDRSWPKDINSNRNEKLIRTPSLRAEVRTTDCVETEQRMKTIEAEGCVNLADRVKPSRNQETAVAAMRVETGGTNNRGGRCTDCNKKIMTAGTSQTKCDDLRKPISGMVPPFVTKMAPTDGTVVMHYQWIVRESVRTTEMQTPSNYLDIPELKIPKLFLKLAEEARNSKVVDDRPTDMKEVQPQQTGQTRPVLITEIMDSTPVLGNRAFRVTNTSTEMNPDINLDEPVNRSGPVGHLRDTKQPMTLGVRTNKGANGPTGPVGHDVMLAGRREMVDPHRRTEQSVFLRLDADQGEHIPTNRVHPGVKMFHTQPVADGPAGPDRTRRPVGNDEMYAVHDEVRPTAGGPVGRFPDPGPLKYSKMSSPDDSYQPLVTGPLGTNEMNAINDPAWPMAGGPLGRPLQFRPDGPQGNVILGRRKSASKCEPCGQTVDT